MGEGAEFGAGVGIDGGADADVDVLLAVLGPRLMVWRKLLVVELERICHFFVVLLFYGMGRV